MQRLKIAGTDLVASRLGFGTASLHHLIRRRDREKLVAAALDNGFTHFDTARMYGEGIAERTLGRYLGSRRQYLNLATKFGIMADQWLERAPILIYPKRVLSKVRRRISPNLPPSFSRCLTRQCLDVSITRSLRALRTDWIDILFIHEPRVSELDSILAIADRLDQLRQDGVVRYLGLAGHAVDCLAVTEHTGELFDVLQVEDSLEGREADVLPAAGRPLQFTYGYLRRGSVGGQFNNGAVDVLTKALARNADGCVLVSTRRVERVHALARCAEQADNPR